ncbi:MAG TPA: IS481 family transposase [Kofleriaceae bacterium]|nr:IS481 family transposase [Kofleriaceae bacterium]
MPWRESSPMDERVRFVVEARLGRLNFAELCRLFGISRKTGYKWMERYEAEGPLGLRARSSAPHTSPQRIEDQVAAELVSLRKAHPTWGPRKLLAILERAHPSRDWPAASTVGDLLKREGLVQRRQRRRHASPTTQPFADCVAPNDTWCIDFKGQFRVGNGLCYPLTMTDAVSRYLLCCRGMDVTDGMRVRKTLERVFREHGLPRRMRSDNGSPFASTGRGGLSRLSVWWIRLGITPERIEPGEPQQNGRHERMHGTLKRDVARRGSMPAQQRALDEFQLTYNTIRPHEALDMRTPAEVHAPSPRSYPRRLPELEYPDGYELRHVRHNGQIRWKYRLVHLNRALAGEVVGLRPEDDGLWSVHFGPVLLGYTDERAPKLGIVRPRWGQEVLPRSPV